MGTHPIFESDFDCLTEVPVVETRQRSSSASSSNSSSSNAEAVQPEVKTQDITTREILPVKEPATEEVVEKIEEPEVEMEEDKSQIAPLVSARQAVEPEVVKAEVVLEGKTPEVEQEVESVDVTEDIAQADEPNEKVDPEVVVEPEVVSDVEETETDANTETDQFAPRNDPSRLSVNEKVNPNLEVENQNDEIPSPATDCTDAPEIPDEVLEDIEPQTAEEVVDVREEKRVEMKSESESDSESESMSQTVEGTSGEPEVTIQPIKEENEEISKTEDVTAPSNDSADKLDEQVTKATESIAQVELKEPESVSEEVSETEKAENQPEIPDEVPVEVLASVPVKEEVVEKKEVVEESPKEPEAPAEIDNEAPVAIPTTDGLETTTDVDGVDIQKTLTQGEFTTDDSMADGVAVLQSTTEATTTSSADSSDSESAKDKTVKENETGELTKEVLSELKMEEKPLLTDPAPEKPVREKSLDLKDEKQVEVSVTNGDVKSQLVQEEIPSADPPRKKRNKFCQCC